ncbi:MAG: tRNA lysidine(34) synthetase TilS [Eubacterium sp.]|nr:tRNA lysidine(34) synthetase TilS [Eubacterium sp.]
MKSADVEKFIREYDMLRQGDCVVAGVSGGADSVCMLLILSELSETMGFAVKAVHLNHMIRGAEADRDEEFVRSLCERKGIPLECFRRDIPAIAKEEGISSEEAGRKIRYQLFEETADAAKDEYERVRIAVAHNRDDLAETVLFNMARGSSLKGLTGIRPVRDNIIRPILFAGRAEIEEYLEEQKEDFCIDSTNLGDDYSRNKIRHVIIPALKELNAGAVDHIFDMAMDATVIYDGIDERATKFLDKCEVIREGERPVSIRIPADELLRLGKTERSEVSLAAMGIIAGRRKDITRKHIESVIDIAEGVSGRCTSLPYEMSAEKHNDKLVIELVSEGYISPKEEESNGSGRLVTEVTEDLDFSAFTKNKYTEIVDYDKIIGTLRVRKPEEADTIVINSSGGRKKLSKLFTDLKVDRAERGSFPVVVDDHDVVWLPGLRLSEKYKLKPDSSRGLRMEYILEGGNPDE